PCWFWRQSTGARRVAPQDHPPPGAASDVGRPGCETGGMTSHTMRAIRQETLGTPEVLKEEELPVPKQGASAIRVRVRDACVNPTDWKHRETGMFLGEPPFVLGWDVSGVVDEVGFGTTLFRPGDEVFGMVPYPFGAGTHAEYVVGPTRAFAFN